MLNTWEGVTDSMCPGARSGPFTGVSEEEGSGVVVAVSETGGHPGGPFPPGGGSEPRSGRGGALMDRAKKSEIKSNKKPAWNGAYRRIAIRIVSPGASIPRNISYIWRYE